MILLGELSHPAGLRLAAVCGMGLAAGGCVWDGPGGWRLRVGWAGGWLYETLAILASGFFANIRSLS